MNELDDIAYDLYVKYILKNRLGFPIKKTEFIHIYNEYDYIYELKIFYEEAITVLRNKKLNKLIYN